LIDRKHAILFKFNGRRFEGYAGDSLASALLANGVRIVARSFKFHRPRGIFAAGVEEPAALVQLGAGATTLPAVRATLAELAPKLTAQSTSGWPTLRFDLGRALDFSAPLWPAGFYNKTFIWPNWHTYEPFIRGMAGFGRAPTLPDPDRYENDNLYCDVLIVGGGMAGLDAALAQGHSGAAVVLVEQDRRLGGGIEWDTKMRPAHLSASLVADRINELKRLANVRIMKRTTATGLYDHRVVTLVERVATGKQGAPRERFWTVRAKKVILATGQIEQPLIFANNDRPGTFLASAASEYLHRYGVAVGSRVLVATNNDSAYSVATELADAGIEVRGLVDSRHEIDPVLIRPLILREIPHYSGTMPINTSGFSALRSVMLGELSRDGSVVTKTCSVACDALLVSGGFNPALQLYAQAGGKLTFDSLSGSLRPSASLPSVEIIGWAGEPVSIGPRIAPVGNPRRQWVDLLHDVTVADLELALEENYTSVEHVKRYTTVGMAADQGKTSQAPTLEVLGRLQNVSAATLGHTTLRPPLVPVTLGAIAGREIREHFSPHRRLPLHDWHLVNGALIQEFGEWLRPVVYLKGGKTREASVQREALQVRRSAGLLDGSSLGKIEVHGPDAGVFLDRFYINDLTTLKPYRARYGLMLKETGIIFDDGTVVMLAPDRYLITTTSSNAGRVAQWLEEWRQCEWPALRVAIVPVTDAWATLSLAGPKARQILEKIPSNIDLSPSSFPHLSMREGKLLGMPARVYRVSFTGELTFEINIPADRAGELWDSIMAAGNGTVKPLGLDALTLLRLEKGFLHLGSDTDGTTVPDDVGWGNVAAKKRGDFIGKRSLQLPEHRRPDRLQLVGLKGETQAPLVIGSHLRVTESVHPTDGWVTSAGLTVDERQPIALALVRGGRGRLGQSVELYDAGKQVARAKIVSPPFYDPAGDRMNA
jgi:sarcosine oxidase subunit alpha